MSIVLKSGLQRIEGQACAVIHGRRDSRPPGLDSYLRCAASSTGVSPYEVIRLFFRMASVFMARCVCGGTKGRCFDAM